MKVLLKILREIGIAIVVLVILAAVGIAAFKDQLPYDEVIRSGEVYVKADLASYSVSSSDRIREIEAITITHTAVDEQITQAEDEVRIQSGKHTPFGNISSTSDLPTEKVGTSIDIDNNKTNSNSSTPTEGELLLYPETAEEAANRRFNNE